MKHFAYRFLQWLVFLGEWLLFFKLMELTPLLYLSGFIEFLSILFVTILAFAVTVIVFRNR
ncbi:hypothetical protein [Sporolactobacillus inulinus]|uniref:Uncharacterized protein n=2 Tax=Sporolactobacillus inulinus TaxID=2078 RepID=A0A4Y1ZGV7_9BACL|nr:hypothetical protein [Sporolactobacillus inulinus]KLI02257.1 hypothetical protein SINU_08945 [Sporolactobacillus inulinus CASD]GAY78426.1 hypothetical protein NBRC111894_3980 [Sporolactobacillus inulinus]GEB77388.1 hypothetical protein SIN01_17330 [Sporolactobacillus inulinus]